MLLTPLPWICSSLVSWEALPLFRLISYILGDSGFLPGEVQDEWLQADGLFIPVGSSSPIFSSNGELF